MVLLQSVDDPVLLRIYRILWSTALNKKSPHKAGKKGLTKIQTNSQSKLSWLSYPAPNPDLTMQEDLND
jgi:hypothetical protein